MDKSKAANEVLTRSPTALVVCLLLTTLSAKASLRSRISLVVIESLVRLLTVIVIPPAASSSLPRVQTLDARRDLRLAVVHELRLAPPVMAIPEIWSSQGLVVLHKPPAIFLASIIPVCPAPAFGITPLGTLADPFGIAVARAHQHVRRALAGPFEIDALVDVVGPATVIRLTREEPLLTPQVILTVVGSPGPALPLAGVVIGVGRRVKITAFLSRIPFIPAPVDPPAAVTPRSSDIQES